MAPTSYREYIRQGMRMMGLKGQSPETVRQALADLARAWAARKIEQVVKMTAEEAARRLLGGK